MVSKGRLLLVLSVGLVAAAMSFVGGTVGALVTGNPPMGVFAVGPPHVELQAGRPFPGVPVTNTMIASWLTCAAIIAIFMRAARRPQLVPTGLQNLVEYVCEFATGFIEGMVGSRHEKRFFPLVMTIFLFVLGNAWLALLPGFDTLELHGVPLIRSANTDINATLMLALTSVVMVEYWGWSTGGRAYLNSFFDARYFRAAVASVKQRAVRAGLRDLVYGFLFVFVGLVELLGHGVRVLSFSFRLFGNMTAGVILTTVAIFLVPLVLPSVFYGLEVLFGLIQAVIFAGLTAVFGYAAVSAAEH